MRAGGHVMRGGARRVPAFESKAVARLEGAGWKMVMLADSLSNEEWPIVVPEPDLTA